MFSAILTHKLRRRSFLAGIGAMATLPVLAACTPQVVTEEKVVVVEKEVPVERVVTQVVEKELDKLITVEVEKPVEIERIVTVEVEMPVEVERVVTVEVEKVAVVEEEKLIEVEKTVEVERVVTVEVEKVVTATAAPETPTPEPGTVDQASIVARLRKNAEDFEYAIGKPGGTLTFATISEPLTFNLAIANDASSSGVLGYVYDGLTETSWLTDEVEPSLAESWTRSDNGLTWTFQLRKDVRWHDGQPFTAHDVGFTFNRIIYNDDIPPAAGQRSISGSSMKRPASGGKGK